MFSATYADEVAAFAQKFVPAPYGLIRLEREQLSLDRVQQFQIDCDAEENKLHVLESVYEEVGVGQCIIFVNTKQRATDLKKKLESDNHTVGMLTGELGPEERDKIIDDFRRNAIKVLLTTNVLARGIDINQVNLVVNFDVPRFLNGDPDCETYLHRIGRTGRFGRVGIAVNLVHDANSKALLKAVERHFAKEIKSKIVRDLFGGNGFLCNIGYFLFSSFNFLFFYYKKMSHYLFLLTR